MTTPPRQPRREQGRIHLNEVEIAGLHGLEEFFEPDVAEVPRVSCPKVILGARGIDFSTVVHEFEIRVAPRRSLFFSGH